MCATPSLRPMLAFSSWVIDRIDIDWYLCEATVFLRRIGRIQQTDCSQCYRPTGKVREKDGDV